MSVFVQVYGGMCQCGFQMYDLAKGEWAERSGFTPEFMFQCPECDTWYVAECFVDSVSIQITEADEEAG